MPQPFVVQAIVAGLARSRRKFFAFQAAGAALHACGCGGVSFATVACEHLMLADLGFQCRGQHLYEPFLVATCFRPLLRFLARLCIAQCAWQLLRIYS